MSAVADDYWLCREPELHAMGDEGDSEFPDITDDREPNWGQA